MSAEMVSALNTRADELDAEAATAEEQGVPEQAPGVAAGATAQRHPSVLRLLAEEFRRLAHHAQGGSQDSAAASSGLTVQKEDADPGQ